MPPGPWPPWAPAWLELPLPAAQGKWYFAERAGIPEVWLVPLYSGPRRIGHEDPWAVLMLWHEGALVRHPWAQ